MTSSLAAVRQPSGHSRPGNKTVPFIGIEDPEIAAEHLASANGHPLALKSKTLPGGVVIKFQHSSNADERARLRTEVQIALSNHYPPERVTDAMKCATNVQPNFLARKLRGRPKF